MKPIEVCTTFPLVMTEATGNSMGNELIAAPDPARVRDSVEGMNMLELPSTVGVAIAFDDTKLDW